jgi:hypothetical protein
MEWLEDVVEAMKPLPRRAIRGSSESIAPRLRDATMPQFEVGVDRPEA